MRCKQLAKLNNEMSMENHSNAKFSGFNEIHVNN